MIPVTGQRTGSFGAIWWLIHLPGVTEELDRYWILASSVISSGDCANVRGAEGSEIVPMSQATNSANVSTGARVPLITSAEIEGTCQQYRYVVSWSDPNGDANRIIDSSDGGENLMTTVSGSQGTWASRYYTCPINSCMALFQVIDNEGNRSQGARLRTTCN